jgi:hypothetical protein
VTPPPTTSVATSGVRQNRLVQTFRLPAGWRVVVAPLIGLALAFVGIVALAVMLPDYLGAPAILVWLFASAAAGVRYYRMAVEVSHDSVVVRGLLRTRTVPRPSVRAVSPYSMLEWRDATGRDRSTPIVLFMDWGRSTKRTRQYFSDQLAGIRNALELDQP